MKIESEQLLASVNKFKNEPVVKNENSTVTDEKPALQKADRVELSATNSEVDRLKRALQDIPDVRANKIALLKERIDSGTYQVDARDVAAKMLEGWKNLNEK